MLVWAAQRPSGARVTLRRVKWVRASSGASLGQRATSSSRKPSAVVCTWTRRPPRPASSWRAAGSLRRKAATCASRTPRRASSVSAVSVPRVMSLRVSVKPWAARASSCGARSGGVMASVTVRRGRSAASGASGATAMAVMPNPASSTAAAATSAPRCWRSRAWIAGRCGSAGDIAGVGGRDTVRSCRRTAALAGTGGGTAVRTGAGRPGETRPLEFAGAVGSATRCLHHPGESGPPVYRRDPWSSFTKPPSDTPCHSFRPRPPARRRPPPSRSPTARARRWPSRSAAARSCCPRPTG